MPHVGAWGCAIRTISLTQLPLRSQAGSSAAFKHIASSTQWMLSVQSAWHLPFKLDSHSLDIMPKHIWHLISGHCIICAITLGSPDWHMHDVAEPWHTMSEFLHPLHSSEYLQPFMALHVVLASGQSSSNMFLHRPLATELHSMPTHLDWCASQWHPLSTFPAFAQQVDWFIYMVHWGWLQ